MGMDTCLGKTVQRGNHDHYVDLTNCGKPWLYVAWTIIWAIFHVAMLMLEIEYQSHLDAKWFVFLSNQIYLIQGVFTIWDCVVTVFVHVKRKDIRDGLASDVTWYIQGQWVLFNVTISGSIMVTLIYYILLTPKFGHTNINKHILNTVYTLLLLSFSAKPVRILHCYMLMAYATAYTIFSVFYQKLSGDPVYSAFDWDKPEGTGIRIVIFIVVCIPIVQMFCFLWYMVRMCVWWGCCGGYDDAGNVEIEMGESAHHKKPVDEGVVNTAIEVDESEQKKSGIDMGETAHHKKPVDEGVANTAIEVDESDQEKPGIEMNGSTHNEKAVNEGVCNTALEIDSEQAKTELEMDESANHEKK